MSNRKKSQKVGIINNKRIKLLKKIEGKLTIEIDETYLRSLLKQQQSFIDDFNSVINQDFKMEQESNEIKEESSNISESNKGSVIEDPDQQQSTAPNGVREIQDFYRRIPHFFMGRFKKWAKTLQEKEVFDYLDKLKTGKKSKQGRYELGDFHKCFQVEKGDDNNVQKTKKKIKELFLEFLQNEAVLQIISYNKITSQEQKTKYIDVVPCMVQEMYNEKPFHEFLSLTNIEKRVNQKQLQFPTMDQRNLYNQIKSER
ncbi:hypothetical protein pb186bvf_006849 [Paramecium bursaria]